MFFSSLGCLFFGVQRYNFFSYEQISDCFFCIRYSFYGVLFCGLGFFRTFADYFAVPNGAKGGTLLLFRFALIGMDRRLNDILELSQTQVELSNLLSLERLAMKYPYCGLLHAYCAKFADILGNQNRDKHLLRAAAYANERSCLKDFMSRPLVASPVSVHNAPGAEFFFGQKPDQPAEKDNSPTRGNESAPQKGTLSTENTESKAGIENILDEINSYSEPDLSENPTREEVIERFLKIENPKVGRSEGTEANPTIDRVIKQSASDNFRIVTETMAKLYLKQGNKDMALQIYRRLLADNPKKSSYFASRIRELEEE